MASTSNAPGEEVADRDDHGRARVVEDARRDRAPFGGPAEPVEQGPRGCGREERVRLGVATCPDPLGRGQRGRDRFGQATEAGQRVAAFEQRDREEHGVERLFGGRGGPLELVDGGVDGAGGEQDAPEHVVRGPDLRLDLRVDRDLDCLARERECTLVFAGAFPRVDAAREHAHPGGRICLPRKCVEGGVIGGARLFVRALPQQVPRAPLQQHAHRGAVRDDVGVRKRAVDDRDRGPGITGPVRGLGCLQHDVATRARRARVRVVDSRPQRQHASVVAVRVVERERAGRLACGREPGDEREVVLARFVPVVCHERRRCVRERRRPARVQADAFARQQLAVHGFGHEDVPDADRAFGGCQHPQVQRFPQRGRELLLGKVDDGREPGLADG